MQKLINSRYSASSSFLLTLIQIFLFCACTIGMCGDDTVKITLLQLNDVYEMTPLGDGRGGLSRVATLKQQLQRDNPHTYALLAGDLVSPSAIGTAVVDGVRLSGKQMIDSFNGTLDFATLGNHEFDIKEDELLNRLAESQFKWVSSNVYHTNKGTRFKNVVENATFTVGGVKVGIFGLTLNMAQKAWVAYDSDLTAVANQQVNKLRQEGAVIIVALTHLTIEQDRSLAHAVPGIDLILGGHEHENILDRQGTDLTPIYKADANARTAYIHYLTWHKSTGQLQIASELRIVDEHLAKDPTLETRIQSWRTLAFDSFEKEDGIDPNSKVVTPTKDLDGRESSVRNKPTDLTVIFAQGLIASSGAEAAIYNGGTIRIDDILPAGSDITEFDLRRTLPFGGNGILTEIGGAVLQKTLEQGLLNKGSGGWLQWGNISKNDAGAFLVNGSALDADRAYKVVFTDFLLTGGEKGLAFLKCTNDKGEYVGCAEPTMKVLEKQGKPLRNSLRTGLKTEFSK